MAQPRGQPVPYSGSVELVLPVGAHAWRIRVHFRPEVAQRDQRFSLAGVLEGHTGFRAVLGAEVFVLGQFVEANEFRAVQRQAVDRALALHADEAISALVLDEAPRAR